MDHVNGMLSVLLSSVNVVHHSMTPQRIYNVVARSIILTSVENAFQVIMDLQYRHIFKIISLKFFLIFEISDIFLIVTNGAKRK